MNFRIISIVLLNHYVDVSPAWFLSSNAPFKCKGFSIVCASLCMVIPNSLSLSDFLYSSSHLFNSEHFQFSPDDCFMLCCFPETRWTCKWWVEQQYWWHGSGSSIIIVEDSRIVVSSKQDSKVANVCIFQGIQAYLLAQKSNKGTCNPGIPCVAVVNDGMKIVVLHNHPILFLHKF